MLLKDIAYYKTGGTCAELHSPSSVEELADVVGSVHRRRLPFFLLGGGTNSLVIDDHFPGAVITFRKLTALTFDGTAVYAQAGVENTQLAEACRDRGLDGTAWMNRLPGQIGGTVRMNARCYGGEISQVVEMVTAITLSGEIRQYRDPGVFRGYKDTIFMTNGEAIAAAVIRTNHGELAAIQKRMDHCAKDRISKGQFLHPSCGCVFKNDYSIGIPSGLLLEEAGVKELIHERMTINPHHANFVFNRGATSREILELTFIMREAVFSKFGVWLEYEMEILGLVPNDLAEKLREHRQHVLRAEELGVLHERLRTKVRTT